MCNCNFFSNSTQEEVLAEFKRNFPHSQRECTNTVCTECYEKVLENRRIYDW